jgi:type II secretory pathway component PulC
MKQKLIDLFSCGGLNAFLFVFFSYGFIYSYIVRGFFHISTMGVMFVAVFNFAIILFHLLRLTSAVRSYRSSASENSIYINQISGELVQLKSENSVLKLENQDLQAVIKHNKLQTEIKSHAVDSLSDESTPIVPDVDL